MNFIKKYSAILCFSMLPLCTIFSQLQKKPLTEVNFEKVQLLDSYVSEGVSIGDIDLDGHLDIVAGSLWWKGPDFMEKYAYDTVKYFPIIGPGLEGYSTNFFTFTGHIDNNRWTDILQVGLPGEDSKWIKDPGKSSYAIIEGVPKTKYLPALSKVGHESPVFVNIIGDENKELLAFSDGRLVIGVPSKKVKEEWKVLAISEVDPSRFPVYSHGLGVGDINGDGLPDIIERRGWWEQPLNWDESALWNFHSYPFSPGKGGAQMFAFDIDGDGDNDVVTAMDGHGYGFSWFEQIRDQGEIVFKEHKVMTHKKEDNPYGVSFSQLHALTIADIDNDGIQDIVTGKCYYAHNGRDPGAEEPAVLYWFKTHRWGNGIVELIPYQIDDDSGVGRQIATHHLNGDGKIDIVSSNKKGVFVFIQK